MADASGDRAKHFPSIEKKHGGPITKWTTIIKDMGEAKYDQQMAFLQENHGFSRAHANAVVMYVRGSTTSKKFSTPEEYFTSVEPVAAKTAKTIFKAVTDKNKGLELVTAWNQPMLRSGKQSVIGLSVAKKHILINPFSKDVMESFSKRLADFDPLKHTFKVPLDWKVDVALIQAIAKARLKELGL